MCADLSALELVFEDPAVAVVVHEDWAIRGHLMVVWKTHVENVSDLTGEDAARLMRAYRRAERAVLELTGAERAIIMKLGIATPHLHLHIFPVRATMTREHVMNVIESRTREPYDGAFVDTLRRALTGSID